MSAQDPSLEDFAGTVRLFPLPNLVFFPHGMQPLHIFEPRYREMTADALAGDHLIAMALLRPGWEGDYEGRPGIYSVACLGKIVADQRQEDGCYNLLLRGLARARILRELPDGKLYRSAEVELLSDIDPPEEARAGLRKSLIDATMAWFPQKGQARENLSKVLQADVPLGALTDLLSFALPLAVEVKQRQLEEVDVERRVRCLLEELPGTEAHRFPPDFSAN
jgi:Lon protease-like protein